MRGHFQYVIYIVLFMTGQAADLERIVVAKGGKAELECPTVSDSEEYNSIMWNKNTVFFVTVGKNQPVNYASGTPVERITLINGHQLILADVDMSDSGNYSCQIYVNKNGSWELRERLNSLTVQDVPSVPGKPQVKDIQSRQVTVKWSSSDTNNSPISSYILSVRDCQANITMMEVATHSGSLEMTVYGLSPYACYVVTVSAVNGIGRSYPSQRSNPFYTKEEDMEDGNSTSVVMDSPASPPLNFRSTTVSSTQIELEWEAPTTNQLLGKLEGFEIKYGKDIQNMKSFSIEDPKKTSTILQELEPYTLYMISIKAKNSAGIGPEAVMGVETKEGLPTKPRITHVSNQQATSFNVNWEPPKHINGKLIQYELQWMRDEKDLKSRYIAGHLVNSMTAYISDLTPYTDYRIQVAAITNGGRGEFSDQFPALTEIAAPGAPRNVNVSILGQNSIFISWERPLIFYKSIDNYIIEIINHRSHKIQEVKGETTKLQLTNLISNSRYKLRIAAITDAVFSSDKKTGDFSETFDFTLGVYDDGDDNVIWDVASSGIEGKQNDAALHPAIIVGIVCAVFILVVIAVLVIGYRFYTCRKCYQAAYLYLAVPSNGSSVQATVITVEEPSEEKQYPDIDIADFISHVKQMHADGDIGFSQEFDEINRSSNSERYMCDISNMADNRNKNRYINILAYDHSRVVLKAELSRPRQCDYINANYVDGYKKPKAYIATQGPLPHTFTDFWRMVWEQNTNVIVMITNLMEKGRRKCDQYWPSDGSETYGNVNVKLITTVLRAHYTVRVFSLRNMKRHSMKGTAERTVYHYHYTEWPDHGVPDFSLPVLSFVQKSAAQSGPDNGPIIVHCSAGVGRTGTYMVIDSMIARIKDQQSINIPGFTQHIRKQRNFLVQTEDQYIFIHEVLVEYLLGNGATEVGEDHMSDYLSDLEQPAGGVIQPPFTDTSLLERQFKLITEYIPSELDQSAALKKINLEKNRAGSIIPVNMKRVLLPARPGVDGSDYINASYLQGYKKSAEFIVTQHPTVDTMEDFWRMVWDKNSPVIVVLSTFDDEEFKEFWPPEGTSIDVDSGNFRLAMKDGPVPNKEQGIVTSEFILDSIQYDYTLMTRILYVQAWPESCPELWQAFDAIIIAQSYLNSVECGPIIVMDRFGGFEAGMFCALWTLRDQLLSEKCADFYQVCKLYHYKRPGIIGSKENYLLLHQVTAAYCKYLQEDISGSSSSPRHHHHNLFHHGSTRQNGTPQWGYAHMNNNGSVPSSHTGRSSGEDNNSAATTPTPEEDKIETNI